MTNLVKARQFQESSYGGNESLLAALWAQQAHSFPRLPADAPPSIAKHTIEVKDKDPEQVYRIYRASRRHQFQLLVETFILQIRYGCCASNNTPISSPCHCSTPTCFTHRRRVAGSKPIRRFNATSARALAVTLASKDNPESALCPHLSSHPEVRPRDPQKTQVKQFGDRSGPVKKLERLNTVLKNSGHKPLPIPDHILSVFKEDGIAGDEAERRPSDNIGRTKPENIPGDYPRRHSSATAQFNTWAEEQGHVKLDPRSFAQNVFNTDAIRMLEWMTPTSIDDLTSKIRDSLNVSKPKGTSASRQKTASETNGSVAAAKESSTKVPESAPRSMPTRLQQEPPAADDPPKQERASEKADHLSSTMPPVTKTRRRSDLRPTSPPGVKPYTSSILPNLKRRDSSDLDKSTKLARVNSFSDDNNIQRRRSNEKKTKMALSPPIISANMFSHEVVLPILGEIPIAVPKVTTIINLPEPEKKTGSPQPNKAPAAKSGKEIGHYKPENGKPAPPQSLRILTDRAIEDLSCILMADAPLDIFASPPNGFFKPRWAETDSRATPLKRTPNTAVAWKEFAEQSIFYVLRNSGNLLESFTDNSGNLLSNFDLKISFHRLSKVAKDIMLDALWIAAGDLFLMPAQLIELQDTAKYHNVTQVSAKTALRSRDATNVAMLIFHALVSTLPRLPNVGLIENTLQQRQEGRSYAHKEPGEKQLELDDALSNDLAIRLARRLFAAISVRECFMLLANRNDLDTPVFEGAPALLPLINRPIPVPASLSGKEREELEASALRLANDSTRVLGLGLRAWAVKIFMEEWDGTPIIPSDGPIAGALSVLRGLHIHRSWALEHSPSNALVMKFVSSRLDASDIPVEWLAWSPKGRQIHLLDHPFLFPKDMLVTYFRAINFSRMSAAYDDAVGTHHRIQALAQPSTLVTDNLRMNFLVDKLRVAMSRFMVLQISRSKPLEDAFDQLWRREERELLRPLKIKLGEDGGELGSDSGGVQAEFFRLAIAQALNPDYGCFSVDERTKMAWFVPSSPEQLWKFELIGLLFALAVYNGLTLPVTFPKAFYKKLIGYDVSTWQDISDGWPDLASGLSALLSWNEDNGSVEDVFCRTYEFSIEAFGKNISRNMKRNEPWPEFGDFEAWDEHFEITDPVHGEAEMVTKDNREEYVRDYVRYLTHTSILPQWSAFQEGFHRVVSSKSLKLFSGRILQEVVEGVQEVDIRELQKVVRYEGYSRDSPTIKDFWSVVREYKQPDRKKLLEFVTASDRVPVGGMSGVTFVIQRNGEAEEGVSWGHRTPQRSRAASGTGAWDVRDHVHDRVLLENQIRLGIDLTARAETTAQHHREEADAAATAVQERGKTARLPTAYTCYGTLLLPEYRDRETLRKKLAMALENAKGFGFA